MKTRESKSILSLIYLVVLFSIIERSAGVPLGCYTENVISRWFGTSAGTYDPATIDAQSCSNVCLRWKFRYSAYTLTACFCADTLPPGSLGSNPLCGTSSELVDVHESNIPVTNMRLSLLNTPNPMIAGTTATFNLQVDDQPTGMTYMMNFDDGAGNTALNATNMYSKQFNLPGTYKVFATAADGTMAGIVISVQKEVKGVSIYCPTNVALNEEFKCNATVTDGTFMIADLSMGDGYTESFPIADANWLTAGAGVPAHAPQISSATTGKIYLNLASQVKQNGLLFAVEFYGTTAGSVNILVLRPACASGTYCLNMNDCSGCTAHVYTCLSGQIFCPLNQACGLQTDSACSAKANKYANLGKTNLQFTIFSTYTLTAVTGYQMANLATSVEVLEGDIIAYTSTTGLIATRSLLTGESADLEYVNGAGPFVVASGIIKAFRSTLRGVYTTKSSLLVVHTYANLGYMPVKLNVSSGYNFQLLNTTILVAIGINDSQIINPAFGITNNPVYFYLLPHTGSNVTYSWLMGNGITINSWVPYINYTYTQKGCYFVNGTSVNIISRKASNMSYICIEDKIMNLVVNYNVSGVGQNANYQFSMTTGSNYLCNWDFGDETPIVVTNDISTPVSGILQSHLYANEGGYNVNVTCYNNVSSETILFVQYIQWPITNLRLESTGAKMNMPFFVVFLFDQATEPTFTCHFDGIPYTCTATPNNIKRWSSTAFGSKGIGVHTVQIDGFNKFSVVSLVANFSLEMLIEGVNTSSTPASEVGADVPVTFTVFVMKGSGINITIDYDDGTPVGQYLMPLSQLVDSGLSQSFTHAFSSGGEYIPKIYVSNSAQKLLFNRTLIVYGKIENVTMVTNNPIVFKTGVGKGYVSFLTPRPLINHNLILDWGDGTIEVFPFSANPFAHNYLSEGVFTINANISNKLMSGKLTAQVVIAPQVENMQLITDTPAASKGVAFRMGVDFDSGGPIVDVYYDFGDPAGANNKIVSRKVVGQILYNSHVYNVVGTYVIIVTCSNTIGNTTMTYLVVVEQEVPNSFIITMLPVEMPDGTATFTIALPDNAILPTNANLTIFYGDDNFSTPTPLPFTTPPYSVSYTFKYGSTGLFNSTIIIKNSGTNFTYRNTIEVYKKISTIAVELKVKPTEPVLAVPVSGIGASKDTFPVNGRPAVYFTVDGSVSLYEVEIINVDTNVRESVLNSTTSPVIMPPITKEGNYKLIPTAINPSGRVTLPNSIIFKQVGAISNPNLIVKRANPPATSTPTPRQYNISLTFDSVSTDACMKCDYGDGITENYGTAACGSSVKGILSMSMNIIYTYKVDGGYNVKCDIKDSFKNFTRTAYVAVVSNTNCDPPNLSIKYGNPTYDNPQEIMASLQIDIIGVCEITCTSMIDNDKQWTAYLVDEITGQQIRRIDKVMSLDTATKAQLMVPAYFLEYGLYQFIFNVTMKPVTSLSSVVFNYIRVVGTPLIAMIAQGGTSLVTRSFGKPVTLTPELFSSDPDIQDPTLDDKSLYTYKWYCRQRDEKFTYFPDSTRLAPVNPSPVTGPIPSTSLGGCYRKGPGILNHVEGSLIVDTRFMRVNDTFVFGVVVSKKERSSYAELQLSLIEGDPPSIIIECADDVLCVMKGGKIRINPTNRLPIKVTCIENCNNDRKVLWTASRKGFNGAWLVLYEFSNYVIGTAKDESEIIAISSNMFIDGFNNYNQLTNFRVEVTMTNPDGRSGRSTVEINVNRQPVGGNCSVTPKFGIESDTNFTLKCSGWLDDTAIKLYQFSAINSDNPDTIIYLGLSDNGEIGPLKLMLGAENDGYKLQLYIDIFDTEGAQTHMFYETVVVNKMSSDKLTAQVQSLLTSEPGTNPLKMIAASGDVNVISSTLASMATALNSDAKNSFADAKAQNDSISSPEDLVDNDEYQGKRDDRASVRSMMVDAISSVTLSSPQATQTVVSTLALVTSDTGGIHMADQQKIENLIGDIMQNMNSSAKSIPMEQISKTGNNAFQTMGNVMASSLNSITSGGTKKDEEAAKKTEKFYYDGDYNSPRQGFIGQSKEDADKGLTRETTKLVQVDATGPLVNNMMDSVDKFSNIMINKVIPGENATTVKTDKLAMVIQKDLPQNIANKSLSSGNASIRLPSLCDLGASNCTGNAPLSMQLLVTRDNVRMTTPSDKEAQVSNYSSTVTLNLFSDGQAMTVKDTTKPIEVGIPRDSLPVIPEQVTNLSKIAIRGNNTLFYYKFNLSSGESAAIINLTPDDNQTEYLIVVEYNNFPRVNGTNHTWDYICALPHSDIYSNNSDPAARWTIFLGDDVLRERNGTWYIGIREMDNDESISFREHRTPLAKPYRGEPTISYKFYVYTTGCLYLDEKVNKWTTGGCKVSPKSHSKLTVCLCNHLTTFGSSFAVQPNTIDLNFVLSNSGFLQNLTLYLTEIIIGILFIFGFIWARWMDKKDLLKLGVTPLPDNDLKDKYLYEIIVNTGIRKNAGTDSKVFVIFSGELEETDARTLEDEKRKVLQRSSQDSFLMAVPRPLGQLNYMRIWHDNSGKGSNASWYCNTVIVKDIQTKEKYHFIINQWFAVEEGDGQISRLISVSGRDDMIETDHLFARRTNKGLSDDHIWFSIWGRPAISRFTRTQRISCCLCLLFTAMFANAMFYGVVPSSSGSGLEIGPFTLTPEQLYVGLISNLIVFPINFIIAFLFKKSRPRFKRPSRIAAAIKQIKEKEKLSSDKYADKYADEYSDTKPIVEYGGQPYIEPLQPQVIPTHIDPNLELEHQRQQELAKKKKKKFELPWWCVIIGWILWFCTLTGCVTGVTFYGIMFQDEKARKWITSMMISFVTSVFLTQPIKVILLAMLFSMLFKKPTEEEDEDEDEDEEEVDLKNDETWMHATGPSKPRLIVYKPPDPIALERAKQIRLKERQMNSILREIMIYSIYIFIVIAVSYDLRDANSYYYKENMLNSFTQKGKMNADNVKSFEDFWSWCLNVFAPCQRADIWYNGDQPIGLRGYLNDYVSRIMGFAVLRQLRIRKGLCPVISQMKNTTPECNVDYSIAAEDRMDYDIKWTKLKVNYTQDDVPKEFKYHTSDSLKSYTFLATHQMYDGGGYITELRGSRADIKKKINEIKNNGWLDHYTRAVIVEFATYNVQTNLFGVVKIAFELIPTGGFDCYYRFDTMNLLGNQGSGQLMQWILYGLFILSIIIFIVKEIRAAKKQKWEYLKQYWSIVELMIIVMSIMSVIMFVCRYLMAIKLTSIFEKSGGNAYMNFTAVAYWNEMLLYLVGVLVFWSSLKFLKLLRFNKTIGLLSATLRYASQTLIYFTIMFGLVFFAFIHFFYLIYLPNLEPFSDLIRTAEQCLMMMVGKFNFDEIAQASPILGTLMFFLYMVVVFFILMTMFIGIVSEAFSAVRNDIKKQGNDFEIADFMVKRFKSMTKIDKLLAPKKKVQPDLSDGKLYDPAMVDTLPERMDRFLDCISQVYFDHDNFESLFKDGNTAMAAGNTQHSKPKFGRSNVVMPAKFDPNPNKQN